MKTIFIFTSGGIATIVGNQIAAHPQIIDIALGVLLGLLFGLLVAVVLIGPSQPEQKQEVVTPKVNKTRKPRRIIEQTAQQGWTFTPVNYPQGAMA